MIDGFKWLCVGFGVACVFVGRLLDLKGWGR
jgi:hypothetical protein